MIHNTIELGAMVLLAIAGIICGAIFGICFGAVMWNWLPEAIKVMLVGISLWFGFSVIATLTPIFELIATGEEIIA